MRETYPVAFFKTSVWKFFSAVCSHGSFVFPHKRGDHGQAKGPRLRAVPHCSQALRPTRSAERYSSFVSAVRGQATGRQGTVAGRQRVLPAAWGHRTATQVERSAPNVAGRVVPPRSSRTKSLIGVGRGQNSPSAAVALASCQSGRGISRARFDPPMLARSGGLLLSRERSSYRSRHFVKREQVLRFALASSFGRVDVAQPTSVTHVVRIPRRKASDALESVETRPFHWRANGSRLRRERGGRNGPHPQRAS